MPHFFDWYNSGKGLYHTLKPSYFTGFLDYIPIMTYGDLSRLGRSYIEVGELLFDTFPQCGIRFISVSEAYDTDTDDANKKKLLILFKNLLNHMYSLDLKRKIKATITLKKQRGEPLGPPPYGYCRSADKKQLEIDCKAAEIVRLIFDMRLHGDSTYSIARYLNEKQILTPQQYRNQGKKDSPEQSKWSANAVSRVLRNATYTGSLMQYKHSYDGKRIHSKEIAIREDTHPAIISKEQFEAVACLMRASASKYKARGQNTSRDARYAGQIFCSRCKKAVTCCESRANNTISLFYSCRYCVDELRGKNDSIKATKLTQSELDAIVLDVLRNCMEMLSQFEGIIESLPNSALFKRKKQIISRDRTELEKIVYHHEQTLFSAYTHHLSGLLDIREYRQIRDKIIEDKSNAESRLAQTMSEQNKYDINIIRKNPWLVTFGEYRSCDVLTKDIVQALIRRIHLSPLTNEVTVELNYMDSFEELRGIVREFEGEG